MEFLEVADVREVIRNLSQVATTRLVNKQILGVSQSQIRDL